MKISVIIPVYNGEAFLEECLRSVAHQSYRDFEAIIVNDGSTDRSLEIAKTFASRDARFKILTIRNSGVSEARNTGVSVAEGEFVTFVDADDCLYPYSLQTLADRQEWFHADVVVGRLSKGPRFTPLELPRKKWREELYDYKGAMRVSLYQKRIMNSPCGLLIRRDFIAGEGGFRKGIRYEDLDAYYRFFRHAERILYIDLPVYFYRENPDSFMRRWSEERLDVLDVTDRMRDFFAQSYPDLLPAALDRRFSAHYNMLELMAASGVDNKEAMDRCVKVVREGRGRVLRDPRVRLKNKIGALVSLGGMRLVCWLARRRH